MGGQISGMKTKMLSAGKLSVLFMLTYMVSYLTRNNYSGIVVEIVSATGFSKAALSVALTGNAVTYAIGQIIIGFLGDRIQPKRLVTFGLSVTAIMNLAIPFCAAPWQMAIIWSINGFAQAFMWPPMVKLMVSCFNEEEYNRGSVLVSYGSSTGTVLIFLLSPLVIALGTWKWVFWGAACCSVVAIAAWNLWCPLLTDLPVPEKKQETATGTFRVTPLLVVIMVAIMIHGALRDGVTTWTPSYISEIYHLGTDTAIFSSVLLPIFAMVCHGITGVLYHKYLRSPVLCSGVLFVAATAAATGLYFLTGNAAVPSVLCIAVLTGCMHGINLMLICIVPRFYRDTGKVSFVSGLLNASAYAGSAISTYGVALLTEQAGWNVTILVWGAIALLGAVLCIGSIPGWNRKMKA